MRASVEPRAISSGVEIRSLASSDSLEELTSLLCPYFAQAHVASAHQFAVAPSQQRNGIGSRLLSHAESWAAANGYAELALDTAQPAHHLVALYRRRGYEHVGFVQWKGKRYRSVLLAKKLDARQGVR